LLRIMCGSPQITRLSVLTNDTLIWRPLVAKHFHDTLPPMCSHNSPQHFVPWLMASYSRANFCVRQAQCCQLQEHPLAQPSVVSQTGSQIAERPVPCSPINVKRMPSQ